MSMRELLTADKERFLEQCAQAENAGETIRVCEDELSRILSLFNGGEENDDVTQQALLLINSARITLPLLDSQAEAEIYETRRLDGKDTPVRKNRRGTIFFIIAVLCLIAGTGLLMADNRHLFASLFSLIGLSVMALSLVLFIAAAVFSRRKDRNAANLSVRIRPDGEKVYHVMYAFLAQVDKTLDDMKQAETLQRRIDVREKKDLLEPGLLNMLSDLLENAYGERDRNENRQIIADISFFLHQNHIETNDYSPDKADWFDTMPGNAVETLRPALSSEGILIRKGLVTKGK